MCLHYRKKWLSLRLHSYHRPRSLLVSAPYLAWYSLPHLLRQRWILILLSGASVVITWRGPDVSLLASPIPSTDTGTSTSTPVHPPIIPQELHNEFTGILEEYHKYLQDFLGSVGVQLPLNMLPFMPHQRQLVPPQPDVPP